MRLKLDLNESSPMKDFVLNLAGWIDQKEFQRTYTTFAQSHFSKMLKIHQIPNQSRTSYEQVHFRWIWPHSLVCFQTPGHFFPTNILFFPIHVIKLSLQLCLVQNLPGPIIQKGTQF